MPQNNQPSNAPLSQEDEISLLPILEQQGATVH